jgi:hypothetical protein
MRNNNEKIEFLHSGISSFWIIVLFDHRLLLWGKSADRKMKGLQAVHDGMKTEAA